MVKIKKLIINADDFGLHESINEGIVAAHQQGCVTSTTIVAGGKAFEHAVMLVRQCPALGIGVHLTLVGLRPVAHGDVSSLQTRDGSFFKDYLTFTRQYLASKINTAHIERELRCQLQRVVGHGIKITHLDSHQHLHALPGFPRLIGRLAQEFGVTKIRIPAESPFFFNAIYGSAGRVLGRMALTGCALQARYKYHVQGIRSTDHFFGMLSGGRTNQKSLRSIIEQLPAGSSEIMVHPGMSNEAINREYQWCYHWQDELAALQSAETLSLIKNRQIELISYRDL